MEILEYFLQLVKTLATLVLDLSGKLLVHLRLDEGIVARLIQNIDKELYALAFDYTVVSDLVRNAFALRFNLVFVVYKRFAVVFQLLFVIIFDLFQLIH